MKRRLFIIALAAEALLCVLFTLIKAPVGNALLNLMAFPFALIAQGLRMLSLSGGVGNALALLFYLALCLLPIGALLIVRRKRALVWEDWLLFVLSVLLFFAVYFMINPGNLSGIFQSIPSTNIVLGGTVYSVMLAYVILRILRLFRASGIAQLQRYFAILLGLLNVVLVYLIFGAGVSGLVSSIQTLREGNVGNESLLGASYVFAALQYLVGALPYVFDMLVVFSGIRLLRELGEDRFSTDAVRMANDLSRLCGIALQASILSIAGMNLLQLIFAKHLFNINTFAQIPLFSIAFVLSALLLSRLIAENKQLKEDNDSII